MLPKDRAFKKVLVHPLVFRILLLLWFYFFVGFFAHRKNWLHAIDFCDTFQRLVELVVVAHLSGGSACRGFSTVLKEGPKYRLLLFVKVSVLYLQIPPLLHPGDVQLVPFIFSQAFLEPFGPYPIELPAHLANVQ